MSNDIDVLYNQWLEWDQDPVTRAEIQNLKAANRLEELKCRLATRVKFGTAGLRAKMGGGNSRINSLTIIQTTQGVATHLKRQFSHEDRRRGVVIGFDGRHQSRHFAMLTAAVLKANGIYTYLFADTVPTPWVSFSVFYLKCIMGIMITASHNTRDYNGYKVFAETGAQIVSPTDSHIAKAITNRLAPELKSWEGYKGDCDPTGEIFYRYFSNFKKHYFPVATKSDIVFTYTAMHGVGTPFATEALRQVGVPDKQIVLVESQAKPHPDFPTVKSPNPEEGREAFALAIKTALTNNSTVILANDPDADRLAVAEWNPKKDDFCIFNGNELAALFGWWAVTLAKERQLDLSKCYFLYSTVSSSILKSIAAKEGMHSIDTLTGFKWMGNIAQKMESEYTAHDHVSFREKRKVLFAFEEAIGFMWYNKVYDKDGVSAAAIIADMARYLMEKHGQRLLERLQEIYKTYGYHYTNNSYVHVLDLKQVGRFFSDIQHYKGGNEFTVNGKTFRYPSVVAGVKVDHVRDLSNGLDTRQADQKATLPTSSVSPIITFYFANQATLTVRGSGTEPKLKWYSQFVSDKSDAVEGFNQFVEQAVTELLRPSHYGFRRRGEPKP
ncbi:phosphomannomutase [Angomonas deanei]|nr:phosphomannomutase [Angomonas deanei]|eukprot:EPY38992.1 phosphomannomutase [Angomonas deanei]